ncbi:MAG: DUF1295 domain-containing protein [Rhodocyclaceae bacterium]|nr:DUF1295 domain-containing protein [Rhodocyclaceae bacterium]MBX3669647.1 DUF1295 domain-containing protein [Rhodocyclaceae bacterium]
MNPYDAICLPAMQALGVIGVLAALAWMASLARRDASLADRFWPLFIAAAALVYAVQSAPLTARGLLMLALVMAWALRLGGYITRRNWGHGEDRRFAALRTKHGAQFGWRSLYLVFGLQGLLAWLVSFPLLAGLASRAALTPFDLLGGALCLFGILYEAVADRQMANFLRDPAQRGGVMARGLWAYSRHPNYFGEACVWWGLGAMAVASGAAWALVSPVLMTVLLLRVSGVTLLEKDIAERRPGYRDYVRRTNAFFPGLPRGSGKPCAG